MGLSRARLAILLASMTMPTFALADTVTVPPVYVSPKEECTGDECAEKRQQPLIICQGLNCLPPENNPVIQCQGQNCMPSQIEECEGDDCAPVENAQ